MANVFKNQEQRDHWNKYVAKYAKENYKTVTVKFSKKDDRELIDYLESQPDGPTKTIKKLLKEKVSGK